ncbi:MAG: GNAT family N-acetyltransferase [Holophagales bacterium]|jgi:GNAT superfamily N-acetyltransferase|nr:GNAT family N-acetyltransferase [Holophagales bacterium]
MLFCDIPLAARIERAEARLLADGAACVARRLGTDRVFSQAVAGGQAAFTEPDSPLNKVAGLGFDGPVPEDALSAIEEAFARHGAPARVELATLGDPALAASLTRRGYVLEGFENVLGLRLPAVDLPSVPDGVRVLPSSADELESWLDVTVTAFLVPDLQGVPSAESFEHDTLRRIVADFVQAEGMTRYLARRAGAPAGGGSLRVDSGIAQLCGAATLPDHRRRGIQTALLSVRLAEAARAGCDLAVVTTQPGSKSQENVQKRGFSLLYSRAILVRTP